MRYEQTAGAFRGERLETAAQALAVALFDADGDAWNDLPMLRAVDHGFLLGDAVPMELVPEGVTRLDEIGPTGFVRVVDQILQRWRAAGRI